MLHLISAHKHLPDKNKALGCWAFAVGGLLIAGLYLLTWQHYEAPGHGGWIEVPGKVNSDGSSWKPDRSLVQFGVRFNLPGETQMQIRPIYADRQAFAKAGLRTNTPVTLSVEPRAGGVIVRELATLEGRVLYDDSLYYHVVTADNDVARMNIVASSVLAVFGMLAGVFFRFRRAGAKAAAQ